MPMRVAKVAQLSVSARSWGFVCANQMSGHLWQKMMLFAIFSS
jgi:hypothetical protein